MSRPASGDAEVLHDARETIACAKTVEQLRQAQAVVFPLDYAMSLADTAHAIGVSKGWACQLRRQFMLGHKAGAVDAPSAGGRKRENMSVDEEQEFLASFLESAAAGGILVVGQIKSALDKKLGRKVALASVYTSRGQDCPVFKCLKVVSHEGADSISSSLVKLKVLQ